MAMATKVSKNGHSSAVATSGNIPMSAPLVASVPSKDSGSEQIVIPEMELRRIVLNIVGTTPLIMHRWSEKAKKQMRDKQQKKATVAKEAKDPIEECRQATYFIGHDPERYGFSVLAFKAAAVDAAVALGGKKTAVRRAFRIDPDAMTPDGPMAEIITDEGPVMREDMVRVGMGTADLRYRPEFATWRANLKIVFDARQMSAAQIVTLFRQAGFSTGIGEWRPEKDGVYGCFDVEGVE